MGMNARKRIYLDINPADRARLLASATDYAAGRGAPTSSEPCPTRSSTRLDGCTRRPTGRPLLEELEAVA